MDEREYKTFVFLFLPSRHSPIPGLNSTRKLLFQTGLGRAIPGLKCAQGQGHHIHSKATLPLSITSPCLSVPRIAPLSSDTRAREGGGKNLMGCSTQLHLATASTYGTCHPLQHPPSAAGLEPRTEALLLGAGLTP